MEHPRSKSRELALQALFYMDMRQDTSAKVLERYCENFLLSQETDPFFLELVEGIIPVIPEIDEIVERFSKNWKISRMSCVDRNALRIAVYEMIFRRDIPQKVSINEAINIGKKFGTEESGAFINGILDSIRIALERNQIRRPPRQVTD
jgi:N utilization substance protein B